MSEAAILVTGGAGFIGSALLRQLIRSSNSPLIVYDKLTYAGNLDSLDKVRDDPRLELVIGDVCDGEKLAEIFRRRISTVYHLAAESHVDRSIDDPTEFARTNVLGTLTLLQAACHYWSSLTDDKDQFRVVTVSTDEVYGSLGPSGLFHESTPISPNSPYAASKAAADHFANAYYRTYGLPVLITNCSNNYGPYQFPEKLIPLMTLNAIESRPLPIYGDGQQIRDWLHVDDHCEALRLVADQGIPGETYNIGGQCERTNLQIVELISRHLDELLNRAAGTTRQLIQYVEDRPGHDRRYAVDINKIHSQLGWSPARDFETGLRETVAWYVENRDWVQRVASGEYRVRRGLGSD